MRSRFYDLFGKEKVVIGMIHLAGFNQRERIHKAVREVNLYEEEGLDGIIVEDYHGGIEDVRLTLEALARESRRIIVGVNLLRDPYLAFEFASTYRAKFVQIDSVQTQDLNPQTYKRIRKQHPHLVVLGGIRFKYKKPTGMTLAEDLSDGMARCDAVVTTGEGTGIETPLEKLKEFRTAMGRYPLISGAGVNLRNVREQMDFADGVIVGSYFKDGNTMSSVIREKVSEFMKVAGRWKQY